MIVYPRDRKINKPHLLRGKKKKEKLQCRSYIEVLIRRSNCEFLKLTFFNEQFFSTGRDVANFQLFESGIK